MAINDYIAISGTNATYSPQIVGVDATGTNGLLWDQTLYDGTPTTNGLYIPKDINLILAHDGTNQASCHINVLPELNNDGEAVGTGTASDGTTHGYMVLPTTFALRNNTDIFQGWDGPSSSHDKTAWTVVGVGATNQLVKVVLPPNGANLGLECVVTDADSGYSTSHISISPVTLVGGDNNIDITGATATTPNIRDPGAFNHILPVPAVIVLRNKVTKAVLRELSVIVLPRVDLTVDIFYAFDPANSHSMLPSGYPQSLTDTTTAATVSNFIITAINAYYNKQANIYFSLGNSYIMTPGHPSGLVSADFDSTTGLINFNPSNMLASGMAEIEVAGNAVDTAPHHIKVFIVKGLHSTGTGRPFLAASNKPYSFVPALTDSNEFNIVCGHEIGRDLDLSSTDTLDGWQFDYGGWPQEFSHDTVVDINGNVIPNQTGLMSDNRGPVTPWIRHEDWQEASGFATNSTLYH